MIPYSAVFVLRACACFFLDLLVGSLDEEGIGSVVAAPFAVTPDDGRHRVGKCAKNDG